MFLSSVIYFCWTWYAYQFSIVVEQRGQSVVEAPHPEWESTANCHLVISYCADRHILPSQSVHCNGCSLHFGVIYGLRTFKIGSSFYTQVQWRPAFYGLTGRHVQRGRLVFTYFGHSIDLYNDRISIYIHWIGHRSWFSSNV